MDHTPFIIASYGIGFCMIAGFSIWTLIKRVRLRSILNALDDSTQENPS